MAVLLYRSLLHVIMGRTADNEQPLIFANPAVPAMCVNLVVKRAETAEPCLKLHMCARLLYLWLNWLELCVF